MQLGKLKLMKKIIPIQIKTLSIKGLFYLYFSTTDSKSYIMNYYLAFLFNSSEANTESQLILNSLNDSTLSIK